jgi:hypothetical protein
MTRVDFSLRAFLLLSLSAGAASAASAQSGAGCKVAYVAAEAVLRQTPGYTAAESIWTKEVEGYRTEVASGSKHSRRHWNSGSKSCSSGPPHVVRNSSHRLSSG